MKSSKMKTESSKKQYTNEEEIQVRQKVQTFVLKFGKYMLYFGKYK